MQQQLHSTRVQVKWKHVKLSEESLLVLRAGQACPFLVALGRIHPEDARDTSKRFELFMFSSFTQPPVQLNYDASRAVTKTNSNHFE